MTRWGCKEKHRKRDRWGTTEKADVRFGEEKKRLMMERTEEGGAEEEEGLRCYKTKTGWPEGTMC